MTTERQHTDWLIGGLFILVVVSTLIWGLSIPDHAVVPIQQAEERLGARIEKLDERLKKYEATIRPALEVASVSVSPTDVLTITADLAAFQSINQSPTVTIDWQWLREHPENLPPDLRPSTRSSTSSLPDTVGVHGK